MEPFETYVYKQKVEARRPEKKLVKGPKQDSSSRRLWLKKWGIPINYKLKLWQEWGSLKERILFGRIQEMLEEKKWHQVTPNQQYSQ